MPVDHVPYQRPFLAPRDFLRPSPCPAGRADRGKLTKYRQAHRAPAGNGQQEGGGIVGFKDNREQGIDSAKLAASSDDESSVESLGSGKIRVPGNVLT